MQGAEQVIEFWLSEIGPEGWYSGGETLDETVRARYGELWHSAFNGKLKRWLTQPRTMLAYLIVTDQFSRNMFRDDPRAYATDPRARAATKQGLHLKFDMKVDEPGRQFFYTPLMHSECITDQDRCVRLMATRMPRTGAGNLLHAKAHREIIRKFGRFPFRNEALARSSSQEEKSFLTEGGYGKIIEKLSA